jgi:hypothetical protein
MPNYFNLLRNTNFFSSILKSICVAHDVKAGATHCFQTSTASKITRILAAPALQHRLHFKMAVSGLEKQLKCIYAVHQTLRLKT